MHPDVTTYQIDSSDRILSTGPGWDRFAHANDGDHLTGTAVLGLTLWDFISDATTRALYQAMADRLRDGVPEITFTFRCDSPGERRLLQMQMCTLEDDGIAFRVTPVLAVERTPVAALDLRVAHSDGFLRMCSWCKRVPIAERQWVEVEVAVEQFALLHRPTTRVITHGICPECEATVFGIVKEPGSSSVGQVELGLFA